jgi:hypothetical protein
MDGFRVFAEHAQVSRICTQRKREVQYAVPLDSFQETRNPNGNSEVLCGSDVFRYFARARINERRKGTKRGD